VVSVADLVVRHLRDAGVRFLFGMPGGGSTLDLLEAAGHAGLPFVLTTTETAGALAAIAQAEISGAPGACLTTLGPGVASVINGVACARLDRAPLLVFTDSHPSSSRGIFEHQRLDHRALLGPVTKWSATLSADTADDVLREAVERAMTEPLGPVHVECPSDVGGSVSQSGDPERVALHASESGPSRTVSARAFQASDSGPLGSADRLRQGYGGPPKLHAKAESLAIHSNLSLAPHPEMERLVAAARRPLFLVGLGGRRPPDAAAIRSLCASHGVPAMVTYKAKGVVPDDDPHFAGIFTNGAIDQAVIAQSDVLIGLGLDPVELIPRPWTSHQPIFNLGPRSVDDRHVPFAAQLVTGIPAGARWLGERLPPAGVGSRGDPADGRCAASGSVSGQRRSLTASGRADRGRGGSRPRPRHNRRRGAYVSSDDAVARQRTERHARRPLCGRS
jgi:acetolactate synthase-1/2/3 large subunit